MTSDPKRLTVVGATDLERTLLQAARRERPSAELSARMAAGLGISAAAVVTAAAPAAAAPAAVAAAAAVTAPAAVTKMTTLAAWVSAGVVAAAITATVVGVRLSATPERPVQAATPISTPVAAPADEAPIATPAPAAVVERRIEKARKRPAASNAGDLRDQIALIDAARTAVRAGATERALVLLRRYEVSYPRGAFRPEALALRIEALDEDGRGADAKALAQEFLARYPGSPIAGRVARFAAR